MQKPGQLARTGFAVALAGFLTRPQADPQIGACLKLLCVWGIVNILP
jgi:hypothetical protein